MSPCSPSTTSSLKPRTKPRLEWKLRNLHGFVIARYIADRSCHAIPKVSVRASCAAKFLLRLERQTWRSCFTSMHSDDAAKTYSHGTTLANTQCVSLQVRSRVRRNCSRLLLEFTILFLIVQVPALCSCPAPKPVQPPAQGRAIFPNHFHFRFVTVGAALQTIS